MAGEPDAADIVLRAREEDREADAARAERLRRQLSQVRRAPARGRCRESPADERRRSASDNDRCVPTSMVQRKRRRALRL